VKISEKGPKYKIKTRGLYRNLTEVAKKVAEAAGMLKSQRVAAKAAISRNFPEALMRTFYAELSVVVSKKV